MSLHTAVYLSLRLLHGVRPAQKTGQYFGRIFHLEHRFLLIPGALRLFLSRQRCRGFNQGGRVFFSQFCCLSSFPVRVPASPAGSRNRELILESGASRQLWERSGGRRRGAQCQRQRGKRLFKRRVQIPLPMILNDSSNDFSVRESLV